MDNFVSIASEGMRWKTYICRICHSKTRFRCKGYDGNIFLLLLLLLLKYSTEHIAWCLTSQFKIIFLCQKCISEKVLIQSTWNFGNITLRFELESNIFCLNFGPQRIIPSKNGHFHVKHTPIDARKTSSVLPTVHVTVYSYCESFILANPKTIYNFENISFQRWHFLSCLLCMIFIWFLRVSFVVARFILAIVRHTRIFLIRCSRCCIVWHPRAVVFRLGILSTHIFVFFKNKTHCTKARDWHRLLLTWATVFIA